MISLMPGRAKFLIFFPLFLGVFLILISGVAFHPKIVFAARIQCGQDSCDVCDPSVCEPPILTGGGSPGPAAACSDGATNCGYTAPYTISTTCSTPNVCDLAGGAGNPNNVCQGIATFPNGNFPYTYSGKNYTARVFSGPGFAQMYPVDDNGSASLRKNQTDWSYSYNGCTCGPDSYSGNGCGGSGSGSGSVSVQNIEEGATLTVNDINMCKANGCGVWGRATASAQLQGTYCFTNAADATPTTNPPRVGSYVPDSDGHCKYVPVQRTLSVAKAGAGSGTVTSAPGGINCGGTCSATYDQNRTPTTVTLTATPSAGSVFAGWSGDCAADGSVTMTANRACTATFNTAPAGQPCTVTNSFDPTTASEGDTVRQHCSFTNSTNERWSCSNGTSGNVTFSSGVPNCEKTMSPVNTGFFLPGQTTTCTVSADSATGGAGCSASASLYINPTATIQGFKVKMPGNDTAPVPPANQTVSVSGGPSSSANPYFLTVNAGATYTVSVTSPGAGWVVESSLCIDNTSCHGSPNGSGTSRTVTIPAGSGHYADLWWHFTPPAAGCPAGQSNPHNGCQSGSCVQIAGCGPDNCGACQPAANGMVNVSSNVATTWTITGPGPNIPGSGTNASYPNKQPGTYTITPGAVAGYMTPNPQSLTLQSGGTITFNLNYQPALGPKVTVTPNPESCQIGENKAFYASYTNATGVKTDNVQATWVSSDPGKATIPGGAAIIGLAHCLSAGLTNITATYLGTSGSASLTVGNPPGECPDTYYIGAPTDVTMGAGLGHQFYSYYAPPGQQPWSVNSDWSSSNPAIATVNNSGIASPVSAGGPVNINAELTVGSCTYTGTARVTVSPDNSFCGAITIPTSVPSGETFNATVVMQNPGFTTWTNAGNYHLGTQNPQDNMNWIPGGNRAFLPAGVSIAPGQNATFSFTAKAIQGPGTYPFSWKMVKEGVAWFGATCSRNITITNGGVCVGPGCGGGPTHKECVNNACTSVDNSAGNTTDRCAVNADCGGGVPPPPAVGSICDAVNRVCKNEAGGGNVCSNDPACGGAGGASHRECQNSTCLIVGGPGSNDCATVGATCSACTLTASPAILSPGGSTTLTWNCGPGVSGCSINNGIGSVGTYAPNNTKSGIKPAKSTAYTLTCTKGGASVTADVNVKVFTIQECNPNDPTCKK